MAVTELKPSEIRRPGMDRKVHHARWSPRGWPLTLKLILGIAALVLVILLVTKVISGAGAKTVRLPLAQTSVASVDQSMFHDLIPLRAAVVPRETIYIDAVDGGRVDRVLVELGDVVQRGQPLIEMSNTNLALSVIQQESQLNQAISQLQQNEIALEQNRLSNERALAEIDYNLVRLERAAKRREGLATKSVPAEQRDELADELAYYQQLKPIQVESTRRQSATRERLLPDIHSQLSNLRANLEVVHGKLDGLIVRAPSTGRVTTLDLKVGENRAPGQRLAELTPDAGVKLSAEIDEFYLNRVRAGQVADVLFGGTHLEAAVRRVSPQVRQGQFTIDLEFQTPSPPNLVPGASAQGTLRLGDDTSALILPVGPFLDRTGGDWVFVVGKDGRSAERRQIKAGRRTSEQLEILSGLRKGEHVIVSDYTGLDRADRILLTD